MTAAPLLLAAGLVFAEAPRVASVVVDAPDDERRHIERYVALKPGDALDAEALRRLVEVVFATGQYEDVSVDTEPVDDGSQRVIIRPRLAPLLSSVAVEGSKVLSAEAARKASGLRPRAPLFAARMDDASRRIEALLARRGYGLARVTAVAKRAATGADAVFTVNAGKRIRVNGVSLEAAGVVEGDLRRRLRPRVGDWLDPVGARESAASARAFLAQRGYWSATVDVDAEPQRVAAGGPVVFRVALGPRTVLRIEGPASGRARRLVEKILREGRGKEDALDEAVEALEANERRLGLRDATVTRRVDAQGDKVDLVLTVSPSPRATVASVEVDGWDRPATLRTRPGRSLDPATLESDCAILRNAAIAAGHAQASVQADASPGGGPVRVVFHVRPGLQTLVESFIVEAPDEVGPLLEGHEVHLRPLDPYRVETIARERDDVVAELRNGGYAQAEAIPEVTFSPDGSRATITLDVRPGQRDIVDRIVVAGLSQTREEVVRRELQLQEGQPLGLRSLLESQRRLSSLGLFRGIEIAETDPDPMGRRNVVVAVEEASPTSVAYGAGYGERDQLRFSVEVTKRNLTGLNRTLSAFARWSFQANRFLATYREPYLRGRRQDLFVTAFREEEERESFSFRRYGASAQTAFALGARWSAILRYSFQTTNLFRVFVPLDEVDRRFQSSTFSGPSVSLVKDSRDDAFDPTAGHFVGIDNQVSLRPLGGDSFVKTFVQASWYRRVGPRTVLAVGARTGLGRAFGASALGLPLADRFFAGGDYSLRGYRLDTAGPRVPSTQGGGFVPTGGNALLLGTVELRVDAAKRFSIAPFLDAGNVYPLVSKIDVRDVLYSAGLGLRYRSALGPLRLDWGYKLNRREGEKPSVFHVTVGHAF